VLDVVGYSDSTSIMSPAGPRWHVLRQCTATFLPQASAAKMCGKQERVRCTHHFLDMMGMFMALRPTGYENHPWSRTSPTSWKHPAFMLTARATL